MISIITESTSYDNTADLIDNIMGTTAPRSAKTFEHIIICTEKNPDLEAFCAKAITMGYPCKIIDTLDFQDHIHINTTIVGFIPDIVKILTSDLIEDIFDCDLFPAIVKLSFIGKEYGLPTNKNGFYYVRGHSFYHVRGSKLGDFIFTKYQYDNLSCAFILLDDLISRPLASDQVSLPSYHLLNTVIISK